MFLIGVLAFAGATNAQVRINEILADNKSVAHTDGSITDWVELINASGQAVSLAGYSLTDTAGNPRQWVFPDGVSIAPNGYLIVLLDSSRPASTSNGPVLNAGFGASAGGDRIEIYGPGVTPQLLDSVRFGPQAADYSLGRSPNGTGEFVLNVPTPNAVNVSQALGAQSTLKINEWMADPSSGDDWFELHNPDPLPVQLTGLHFRDNGNAPSPVAPYSYIGSGTWGFLQMFADNSTNDNEVDFGLSAGGDSIGLYRADNTLIDRVEFGPQSEGASEGRLPDGSESIRFLTVSTPAESNLILYPGIVVNEVLNHTDPPYEDAVEFYNTTGTAIPIGGWYLSNSRTDLKRYRIPDNTVIPANGYLVLYENQFNGPGAITPFTFNAARGDQVYLAQAVNNDLTGAIVQESFEAAENGVSFGRVTTSMPGDYKFVALLFPTFGVSNPTSVEQFRTGAGALNAPPRVGPLVIHEIHYHPLSPDGGVTDNTEDEFIELLNLSAQSVPLFDPLFPTNRWRLQGAVDFVFPPDTTLAPAEAILVVSFDPSTNATRLTEFRSSFDVPPSVRIFGPYDGKLSNSSDEIELYKPDAPQPAGRPDAGFVPYLRVDKVNYSDVSPWPAEADGTGNSLQRKVADSFGNDPANWEAGVPTPGKTPGGPGDEIRLEISRSGGDFQLQFNATSGESYTIEFTEELQVPGWELLTTVTASGSVVTVSGPITPGRAARFYRVVAEF
jgi:hypothetical protein